VAFSSDGSSYYTVAEGKSAVIYNFDLQTTKSEANR
jgi:hypothetical protein